MRSLYQLQCEARDLTKVPCVATFAEIVTILPYVSWPLLRLSVILPSAMLVFLMIMAPTQR